MKFGVCVPANERENIEAIAQAGADYIEMGLGSVEAFKENEMQEFSEYVKALGVPVYAFCMIVPWRYRISGDAPTHEELVKYFDFMLNKTKPLGADCWVLGSGKTRKMPEDGNREACKEQILGLLKLAAPVFEKHGVTLVIEPLNKNEDNMINTVADGMEYVQAVASPAIKGLSDFFHADLEGEDFSDYAGYGDNLRHCHIAAPERALPLPGDGQEEKYKAFLSSLKNMGYEGGLTIEVRRGDTFRDQIAASLSYLRSLWAEV